jgi:hypothetical protein
MCDVRPTNPQLLPWKNKYWGLHACIPLCTPGAFCFSKDFSSAYHNVMLATPCGQRCLGCRACVDKRLGGGQQCAHGTVTVPRSSPSNTDSFGSTVDRCWTMEDVSHHRTLNPQICRSWVPFLLPRPDRWSYGVGVTEVSGLYTRDVR